MKVELKNILCATDLSDFSSHAVSYAIAMAREFNAKLYLCHVFDLPSFSVHGTAYVFQPQQQDNLLKYAAEKLETLMEKQSIEWELIVTTGPIADTIARQAEEKEIDMAVGGDPCPIRPETSFFGVCHRAVDPDHLLSFAHRSAAGCRYGQPFDRSAEF